MKLLSLFGWLESRSFWFHVLKGVRFRWWLKISLWHLIGWWHVTSLRHVAWWWHAVRWWNHSLSLTSTHRHARSEVVKLILEWLLLPRWLELRLYVLLETHILLHRHGHTIVWLIHVLIPSEILIVLLFVLEILRVLHSLEIALHILRRSKGPWLGESRIGRLEIGGRSEGGSTGFKLWLSDFHGTLFHEWVCAAWWLSCGSRGWDWCLLLYRRSYLRLDLLWNDWLSRLCRYRLNRSICSRDRHLCLRLGWRKLLRKRLINWRKIEEWVYLLSHASLSCLRHFIEGIFVYFGMERFELAFCSGHIRKNSVEFTDCLLIKSVNSSIFLFFIGVILKSNLITLFGLMPILSLWLVDLLFDFYALLNSSLIKLLDIQLRTIDSILVCRLLFVFELIELLFCIGLIQCLMW